MILARNVRRRCSLRTIVEVFKPRAMYLFACMEKLLLEINIFKIDIVTQHYIVDQRRIF